MTPPREEDPPEDTAARAAKIAAGLGVVLTLGALALMGGRTAGSVALGAAIAVANLVTMRKIIRSIIRPPAEPPLEGPAEHDSPAPPSDHKHAGSRGGAAWSLFAVLKILVLFGGIWFLLTRGVVDPMPLVVGYGVLPLGITASALWPST